MSTAVVFLDIETVFATTWHPGLYKILWIWNKNINFAVFWNRMWTTVQGLTIWDRSVCCA